MVTADQRFLLDVRGYLDRRGICTTDNADLARVAELKQQVWTGSLDLWIHRLEQQQKLEQQQQKESVEAAVERVAVEGKAKVEELEALPVPRLEAKVEKLEALLKRMGVGMAEALAVERRLREEQESELKAARAEVRSLAEIVRQKDEALQQLTEAEEAAARAAEAARVANAPPAFAERNHVWRLGSRPPMQSGNAEPPPPLGYDAPGQADGLARWLTNGGTDAVCSVVAKAMCKLVEAIGQHPGLCSNGFFEDGVLAATAGAAAASAARESQHREHRSGRPLDVIKAALDGAAAHVAASDAVLYGSVQDVQSVLTGVAIGTDSPAPTDESAGEEYAVQMEALFQHVLAFDENDDGFIDEVEMKLYLVAVGAWASEDVYSDTKWPRSWPGICTILQADAKQGLPLESFKMFHEKYRRGPA
jgi:hypothetical protein